ncbi:hypothetical protein C1E24_20590 [Pseudoalteromonas phenolica]|uniref:Type II toxin-antitoxin system MqsA family antitoxin n=1 Tax=Pseudoalteromonas phenolica TaxID=161398 RepID=A0A5R9PXJ8_9GAMM|nr:type II toxin-antitoxin system MqsA family antitoxin [Pseudoalteromonas phenolica]TLX45122.1 hypothetical protein C1E24_20590 [Pseudoalteromonas phenolica]
MTNCKLCKSENIVQLDDMETITYKGTDLSVSMEYSICNDCGREFVSKQQILNNDSRVRDAKKSVDGLLTSSEIYHARTSLGLTQEQASLVFGGGKNAFSKYERAEVSQSAAMDKLIRVCLKHQSVLNELLEEAGIKSSSIQLSYENNVIPYPKYKAANQPMFRTVKSVEVSKDVSYG